MYSIISDYLKKVAHSITADYSDTQQFVYTNPGQHYPSAPGYSILHGPPSMKQNEPWSKKRDEEKKYDTIRLGPGPNPVDVFDRYQAGPDVQGPCGEPGAPKTDAQGEVKNTTKARGDEQQEELNRDTYRTVGGPNIIKAIP